VRTEVGALLVPHLDSGALVREPNRSAQEHVSFHSLTFPLGLLEPIL
jgi:hypothetical protein